VAVPPSAPALGRRMHRGATRESPTRPLRLLFTAGGSGGHIYPALAIAREAIAALGACVVAFVGARGGMEERLVREAGFALLTLPVAGIVRKRPPEAIRACLALGGAIASAVLLVRRLRPDVVVGTGGYAAGPVGVAAVLCGVPLVLQEQNVVPGVTNRLLARFAATVAVPFGEAARHFPRGTRLLLAGNPVRREVLGADPGEARRRLGLPVAGRVVLMMAGSKGSTVFVRWFQEMLPHWYEGTLLFVCGAEYLEVARAAADRAAAHRKSPYRGVVKVLPYLPHMGDGLAAADLVVCRAGAMTLAELAAVGRAAILIPSPHVTHHHQDGNAAAFARAGAARILAEDGLDGATLGGAVVALLGDAEARQRMAQAARSLDRPDSLARIVAAVAAAARAPGGGMER